MMNIDINEAAARAGITPEALDALSEKAAKRPNEMTREERATLRSAVPPQVRPCGECTLCCTAPAIEEGVLAPEDNMEPKPACQTCKHLQGGCTRYETRPEICRDYQCMWSLGMIPEEMSPMACGVAWTIQVVGDGTEAILMGHTHNVMDAVKNPLVQGAIELFMRSGRFAAATLRDDVNIGSITPLGMARAKIDQTDPMKMRVDHDTEQFRHHTS